ncbi:Response regulator protein TodT [Oligella sp. MSHR50489EDL]|uniref:response regulator transcription factor n=1 Tax=Oligella sp. MSHR50489EDL TaxID=3139409 RepID=UPI003D813EEB
MENKTDLEPVPIVYVIDDDASMQVALEDLLSSVGLCVRVFSSTHEFLKHTMVDAPGCLVLDVRLPEQSGMDFHRQMQALGLDLPVVFITGHGDISMSVSAMKHGAIDFLSKPFCDQDLLEAIQKGIEKDKQRRQQEHVDTALRARWLSLTEGERKVIRLVVKGLLNKQIAHELHLSEVTIKVRRAQAMRKMQVSNLVELVRLMDRLEKKLP